MKPGPVAWCTSATVTGVWVTVGQRTHIRTGRRAPLRPRPDSCPSKQNAAIAAYVRWRNARAGPKTNFAPASPIRSWTEYPAKAA
ncbi:hypothetical protein [Streptomyces sp. DSM 40750]|uniref:hypothetical protein n=1 Tax=Streptomyces sp. DSM 40750 TaxID=2801030 RepID=UPI00214C1DE4|nr:hypothetical protein [Streptomyces sp. DSM 40750]UUU22284.1 hypothetical protein JIX55_19310 [Streptomyces sp. DSM 40750]